MQVLLLCAFRGGVPVAVGIKERQPRPGAPLRLRESVWVRQFEIRGKAPGDMCSVY